MSCRRVSAICWCVRFARNEPILLCERVFAVWSESFVCWCAPQHKHSMLDKWCGRGNVVSRWVDTAVYSCVAFISLCYQSIRWLCRCVCTPFTHLKLQYIYQDDHSNLLRGNRQAFSMRTWLTNFVYCYHSRECVLFYARLCISSSHVDIKIIWAIIIW